MFSPRYHASHALIPTRKKPCALFPLQPSRPCLSEGHQIGKHQPIPRALRLIISYSLHALWGRGILASTQWLRQHSHVVERETVKSLIHMSSDSLLKATARRNTPPYIFSIKMLNFKSFSRSWCKNISRIAIFVIFSKNHFELGETVIIFIFSMSSQPDICKPDFLLRELFVELEVKSEELRSQCCVYKSSVVLYRKNPEGQHTFGYPTG